MTNDTVIEVTIRRIKNLIEDFERQPNQCAYTDSIVSKIIEHSEILKNAYDTNEPEY